MNEDHSDNGCNYLDCLFENGGLHLDVCQGTCGGQCCFHHACNLNWVERKGLDADLCKLCHTCVRATFGYIYLITVINYMIVFRKLFMALIC